MSGVNEDAVHNNEVPDQRPTGAAHKDWRRPANPDSDTVFSTDWAQVANQSSKRSYGAAAARASRTSAQPALTDGQAAEFIAGLPANQTRYATELWEWVSGRGLSCPRQTSDTFKHMLTWSEAQAILNAFYRRD